MKRQLITSFFLSISLITFGQDGLIFSDVFYHTISGEKIGVIDVVQEQELIIEKGEIVKISFAIVSETSPFDNTPNVLTNSNQGMLFINDFPVTNLPEANTSTVAYPIWLKQGIYKVRLVAHTNSIGKKLKGFINGLIYRTQ